MKASTPLHILVLTDRDWTHPQGGGTGTNLYGQIVWWQAWGHRVSVIACGYPGAPRREVIGDVEIHRVGGRSTVFPQAIWHQARGLVRDPDVVLEVVNGITFLTPLWLRTPRVTLLHHGHARHYREEMGAWAGAAAHAALERAPLSGLYRRSRFMTVSEASAGDIAAFGIPRERIAVNYNGVDSAAYVPGERAPEPTLLYVGRVKRYKHVERLLDALDAVPGSTLDVAGDGDARPSLEAAIAARGLTDRVRLHGYVDEPTKLRLLQRAWVHLTASTCEGWSFTVMEAAACATPTVALAVGGLRESVRHGETGLLARDVGELAAHTRTIVGDPALRERLGRAACERAGRFTWERTARTTLELLEAEHRAGAPASPTRPLVDTARAASLAAATAVSGLALAAGAPAAAADAPPARPRGLARARTLWRLWRAEQTDPAPFYRFLAAEAAEDLERRHGPLAGRTIADLGCGPGFYTAAFRARGAHVLPIDSDAEELALAGDPPPGALVADARALPLEDASVDGVFCSNLLEHTPEPERVLHEIARVLRPGGWGYVSWTNWYSPWGGHDMTPYQYLGPRLGPRLYERRNGPPRKNAYGDGLWATHIGPTLRAVRRLDGVRIESVEPRYWPWLSMICRVPGVREVLSWNCVIRLVRT